MVLSLLYLALTKAQIADVLKTQLLHFFFVHINLIQGKVAEV